MRKHPLGMIVLLTALAYPSFAGADFGALGDMLKGAKEKAGKVFDNVTSGNTSPAQSRWNPPVKSTERDRLNKNYSKTIVQGAAVGAGLGALVAKIKGKDKKDTVKYAAVGGVVGGLVGNHYAKQFETMAQDKRKTERQLSALKTNRDHLVKKLDAVKKNIAYIQSEIRILDQQLARGAVTKAEYDDFARQAVIELKDAQEAFEKTKLTYVEAQETHDSIVKSSEPDVVGLAPQSEAIRDDLKKDTDRADKMGKDVSALIEKLT